MRVERATPLSFPRGRGVSLEDTADNRAIGKHVEYQSSVSLTRWGFPNQLQNDSRWRTEVVCHGDCHCDAEGLFQPGASSPGDASEGGRAGADSQANRL